MEDKKHLIYKEDLLDLFTVQAPSMSYNKMFMAVANSPTVDAVPVVHGRWIWKDGCFHCSNCKTSNDHTPKYCEGCGAKMDLEVKDA